MTPREKLRQIVDRLSEAEVEAAVTRLEREHEAVEAWAGAEDVDAVEDSWAVSNAREAIREAPW